MPQQYSSISRHLTPTSTRHEDMRLDPSLNVTPEGSLGDLPTAVGNTKEAREGEHQVPEERSQGAPFETSIEGTPDTLLKVKPEINVRETPRRIQRTREASREDAIASTQQFFAAVNERNRSIITEGPTGISSEVCERNENGVPVTFTSVVTTTPVAPETKSTETENQSPRTFLPNGSPSRPTATATCGPRMWVQCISEGQINEPTPDDTHSTENGQTETSVLAEGIQKNWVMSGGFCILLKYQE